MTLHRLLRQPPHRLGGRGREAEQAQVLVAGAVGVDRPRGDDGLGDRPAHERHALRRPAVRRAHAQADGRALVAGHQVESAAVGEAGQRPAVDRRDQVARAQAGTARREARDRRRDEEAAVGAQHGDADARVRARLGVLQQAIVARREVARVRVVEPVEHPGQCLGAEDAGRERRVVVRREHRRHLAAQGRLRAPAAAAWWSPASASATRSPSQTMRPARRRSQSEQIWTVPLHRSAESVLRHIARERWLRRAGSGAA